MKIMAQITEKKPLFPMWIRNIYACFKDENLKVALQKWADEIKCF